MAKLHDNWWTGVYPNTQGIVFLGTPNRGTGPIMSKGLLLAAIASDESLHTEGKVLEILEQGNDALTDLLADFLPVIRRSGGEDIQISCFWEQKISNVGRIIGKTRIEVSAIFHHNMIP